MSGRVALNYRALGSHAPFSTKTDQVVPMETLGNIAQALSELVIEAPVTVSQVLVRDLAGTGANLLACQTIAAVEAEENTADTETE